MNDDLHEANQAFAHFRILCHLSKRGVPALLLCIGIEAPPSRHRLDTAELGHIDLEQALALVRLECRVHARELHTLGAGRCCGRLSVRRQNIEQQEGITQIRVHELEHDLLGHDDLAQIDGKPRLRCRIDGLVIGKGGLPVGAQIAVEEIRRGAVIRPASMASRSANSSGAFLDRYSGGFLRRFCTISSSVATLVPLRQK